jgi:hypothetical protein
MPDPLLWIDDMIKALFIDMSRRERRNHNSALDRAPLTRPFRELLRNPAIYPMQDPIGDSFRANTRGWSACRIGISTTSTASVAREMTPLAPARSVREGGDRPMIQRPEKEAALRILTLALRIALSAWHCGTRPVKASIRRATTSHQRGSWSSRRRCSPYSYRDPFRTRPRPE